MFAKRKTKQCCCCNSCTDETLCLFKRLEITVCQWILSEEHISQIRFIKKVGRSKFGDILKVEWRGENFVFKPSLSDATCLISMKPHPRIIQVYGVVYSVSLQPTIKESNAPLLPVKEPLSPEKKVIIDRPGILLDYYAFGCLEQYLTNPESSKLSQSFVYERIRSQQVIARLLCDVAHALFHVHSEGWIYRDLAARNILLRENNGELRACLTDFEWSVRQNEQGTYVQSPGLSGGPFRVMAPEASNPSQAIFSPATDVWSFGVLIFSLVERKRPYEGWSSNEVRRIVLDGSESLHLSPHHFNFDLFSTFSLMLENCLKREPRDRVDLLTLLSWLSRTTFKEE